MNKKQKEKIDNMYYNGTIEKRKNEQQKEQKKKVKEREKRIKEINKNKKEQKDRFDLETETVIGMTQKNRKIKNEQIRIKNERNDRKIAKKKKKIKKILNSIIIIGIITGGTVFAFVSPIFNIKEIEITGNEEINKETITSLSKINKDENIFKFINKKIELNIKENPYIENVKIKRKLPNKILIEVEERKKEFNIEFMNGYAYIDNQGNILEIGENKLELPIIQGITMNEEEIVPGNRLKKEDLEKLETINQIMNIWNINQPEIKITSIDAQDKQEYTMIIEQEKKKVYIGDSSNLNDKILWVQAIIKDNKNIEGEIFVNGDLNSKFKPRFKQKV